jgi:uncharacterized membrane protein YphA (DoxX/SURF4 family)
MSDQRSEIRGQILDGITWVARIVLGAIFIYASWHKLRMPGEFALDIFHYQLAPGFLVNATAILLPWVELFAGIALIVAPRLRFGAAILILGMLVVFTSAIAINLYRGIDVTCGCFSSGGKGQRIGTMKVFENLGMIIAAWFLVYREKALEPKPPRFQL